MPRENPNGDQLVNPAKFFYSWSGDEGVFQYYDAELKKKINVAVTPKTPFIFLPIDVLSTVKGFSEADSSGYTANEVRDTTKEILTVKTWTNKKANVKAIGLWADIKDKVKAGGGKFSVSIYAAMKNGKSFDIVNIQMYGAALNAWIDYAKSAKIYETAIAIRGNEEKKKGKIVWFVPVLESLKVMPATDDAAGELQKVLKEYHTAYFTRNANSKPETVSNNDESTIGTTEKYTASENSKKIAATNTGKQEQTVDEITDTFGEDDQAPF